MGEVKKLTTPTDGMVYKNYKRLQNAKQAKEFLQHTINAFDKGEISEPKARTLGYLIKIFLDTYQVADVQDKVEELERLVKEG